MMTYEEIEQALEGITYQPLGNMDVPITASVVGTRIILSMSPWVPHSRGWDFVAHHYDNVRDDEDPDREVFVTPVTMNCAWPRDIHALYRAVTELVAYQAAHEALEWLYDTSGKALVHDPHEDGNVTVYIPRKETE